MSKTTKLSEKWLKASVLGAVWASSEIVLGSFLHNLRIPFAGNILTSIAVILLISIARVWRENGIFWRAGLVCALMKTMSPSAVIFGPMIAIFTEGLLIDFSIRVFGRNAFGFLLAGITAMSWNVVQKVLNFLIIYGLNIVDLYENLVLFAKKQLQTDYDIFWLPVILLFAINIIWGIIAAIFGIIVGNKAKKGTLLQNINVQESKIEQNKTGKSENISYSLLGLFLSFLAMLVVLFSISFTQWIVWTSISIFVIIVWGIRYKNALRTLRKIKFWITFITISFLASYLFYWFLPAKKTLFDAFLAGWEMNVRAAVLMIGFSVIGKELYNPRIRSLFSRSGFSNIHLSVETAFETLPYVMANTPKFKQLYKAPLAGFLSLAAQAEKRFAELKEPKYSIVTGKIGGGKTSYLIDFVKKTREEGQKVAGILSHRIIENGERTGYEIEDLSTGKRVLLANSDPKTGSSEIGKFYFSDEGLQVGHSALTMEKSADSDFFIIDEIGPLELRNEGWHDDLMKILNNYSGTLILAIREHLAEEIIKKYKLSPSEIRKINELQEKI